MVMENGAIMAALKTEHNSIIEELEFLHSEVRSLYLAQCFLENLSEIGRSQKTTVNGE